MTDLTTTSTASTVSDSESARWRVVAAEHGIAALRYTHWLDPEPRRYPGVPGEWSASAGRVLGRGLRGDEPVAPAGEVSLAPAEEIRVGPLLLRAFARDGALALRVFDPESPSRTRLRAILSFPRAEEWVLPGAFRPAADGETRVVRSADGYEREEEAVGVVALEIDGRQEHLTVSRGVRGLSAVIADGTSGVDAYRFRFLPIDAPAADGSVTVDFNRAHLPPCAFSDQYVCPLPPAGNRLETRIEAGERLPDLAETALS